MAALHDALTSLGPLEFFDAPQDNLKPFLFQAFSNGQLIVDSVPIPPPPRNLVSFEGRPRASSNASSAAEVTPSSARSAPPSSNVEALQKEWKGVKLSAKENPLSMSVYKLAGKDGKGAWFARRSVHEGLGFTKWKKAVESEFPESMKVQGPPGEGNIRGIGGEKRVAYRNIKGVGKMEVYLLSAQFPGPTTPRDFVTMFLTSDQSVIDESGEVLRQFIIISRPCVHPDAPQRDGYIRGQYESVEFIREVPTKKGPTKSASTTNLFNSGDNSKGVAGSTSGRETVLQNAKKSSPSLETAENGAGDNGEFKTDSSSSGRTRGKTISFDHSRNSHSKEDDLNADEDDEEIDYKPVEWIMVTRSDPGGSVPRFLIERGSPSAIVADAGKLLDWACAKDLDDFESGDISEDETDGNLEMHKHKRSHQEELHNLETNGYLAGIEEESVPTENLAMSEQSQEAGTSDQTNASSGVYGMVAGVAGAASGYLASHTPQGVQDHLSSLGKQSAESSPIAPSRQASISSINSASSVGTFASALEKRETGHENEDTSIKKAGPEVALETSSIHDKELAKLEEKKRNLDEKLAKAREKEINKKSEDRVKEEGALRKASERHDREVQRHEAKYRKEVEKLEGKKEKERRKAEERKRKLVEKDERLRLTRELEEKKTELNLLRKEKDILRTQVGELQAENTVLAAKLGRFGVQGEDLVREVKQGAKFRADSLKSLGRTNSFASKSGSSSDK